MQAREPRPPSGVQVRPARQEEHAAIGALTVVAYRHGGLLDGDTGYEAELADAAGRAATTELLVAVDATGRVVGTATLCLGTASPHAELAGEDDAELRMLAVAPEAQGTGVGRALVEECLDLARRAGCRRFVLSSRDLMRPAHRLYERLGFIRAPALDWEPSPGIRLLAYVLDLDGAPGRCDRCGGTAASGPDDGHEACRAQRALEPPRYCRRCGRRLVVQVTPRGWTARCSQHGITTG
ncbi:MAG: GNAT family N-acetyltransferase [Frankiaceae bacterium]